MLKNAFNSELYLVNQEKAFKKAIGDKCEKLYVELGGKIIQDKHSTRVLPGYEENLKLDFIKKIFHDDFELIFVISAKDIENARIRGDFNIDYANEATRVLNELAKLNTNISHIVISMIKDENNLSDSILEFKKNMEKLGKNVFLLKYKKFYEPSNNFIQELKEQNMLFINKKVIVATGPGGGSGKFAFCISQLFHEMNNNISPKYVKFETFPVHNLPLNHPLNLAYIASTADLLDKIVEDKHHKGSTSYNRDAENYELLKFIASYFPENGKYLRLINSATEMGVNCILSGIVNDNEVCKESAAEVARRYMRYKYEVEKGTENMKTFLQAKKILEML